MNQLDLLIDLIEVHDINITKGIVISVEAYQELLLLDTNNIVTNKKCLYYRGYKIICA